MTWWSCYQRLHWRASPTGSNLLEISDKTDMYSVESQALLPHPILLRLICTLSPNPLTESGDREHSLESNVPVKLDRKLCRPHLTDWNMHAWQKLKNPFVMFTALFLAADQVHRRPRHAQYSVSGGSPERQVALRPVSWQPDRDIQRAGQVPNQPQEGLQGAHQLWLRLPGTLDPSTWKPRLPACF